MQIPPHHAKNRKKQMQSTPPPITYIIFARIPRLGAVKTRLAGTLGNKHTLRLYEAMLLDTLHGVSARNPAQILLFVHPAETCSEMAAWCKKHGIAPATMSILPQSGSNLGNQMLFAFRYAQSKGFLPAIILGTDSPTVPQSIWQEAEECLLNESNTAVLGRSTDGGFYAMGLQSIDESFFFGDNYSNDTVFERTWKALQSKYAQVRELPEWSDIDDEESLWKVITEAEKYQYDVEYEVVKCARCITPIP
jgi:rSAM/selenodomain-associated transferase 1